MKYKGKNITIKPKAKFKKFNLTYFVVFYDQPIEYVKKTMESVIDCYDSGIADFIITVINESDIHKYLLSEYSKFWKKIIKFKNIFEHSRNNRLLDSIGKIDTKYIMLIDGDDFVDVNKTNKISSQLNTFDFFNIEGSWSVSDEHNNIYIKDFNNVRSESGLWVQSYIFGKEVVQKIIGSEFEKIVRCNSLSDNILGAVLLELSEKPTYLNSDSPYIHRENSKSSVNSKANNSTDFWRTFYKSNSYCKLWRVKSIGETLSWISENSTKLIVKEKIKNQLNINDNR